MSNMKKILVTLCLFFTVILSVSVVFPELSDTVNVEAATKIKLNKTKATLITGDKLQLKLSKKTGQIEWNSSKKNVATVNKNGKVTAKKKGTTIITAKMSGKKYTCKITVKKKVALKSISLNKTKLTMNIDDTYKLIVKYTPTNTTDNKDIQWFSSDDSVADVDEDGEVYAYKAGTTVITAKVGKKKATCEVTVKRSAQEIEQDITYISDRSVEYVSDKSLYRVFFSLLLSDSTTRVASSGTIVIGITNNDGKEVYNKEIAFTEKNFDYWTNAVYGTRYLCCIEIPRSDIIKGGNSTGKFVVKVYLKDGSSFPESSYSINNLPVLDPDELCKVVPPETPDVLAHYYTLSGKTKTICTVTDVKCNVTSNGRGGFNLDVILSGTKEYDSDGVASDSPCRFKLKLYKDNQVIDSKSVFTPYVYVGESFSNLKQTFYGLEEGTYELILTDD